MCGRPMPALFTTMSRRPQASSAVWTSAAPPSGVEMSWASAITSPPAFPIAATASSAGVSPVSAPSVATPTSFTTTRAPYASSRAASAPPMPRPAPVTTATLPSSVGSIISSVPSGLGSALWLGRLQHGLTAAGGELRPQCVDVGGGEAPVRAALLGLPPHLVVGLPAVAPQHPLEDLARLGDGERRGDAHEARCPLRAQVGLGGEECGAALRFERRARPQLQRGHDAVADVRVGHRVHGRQHHVGPAGEDALDGRGGEVPAVDPQPIVVATGEEEVALLGAIGEVSGPVGPVVDARRGGLVLVPGPL